MRDNIIKRKVNVFISSRCGDRYSVMRKALATLLEETNLVSDFVYEAEPARTVSVEQSYSRELDQSDIVIFLIDNKDGPSDGVLKEYSRARQLKKKALYIFCDQNEKRPTELEKDLVATHGNNFKTVHEFSDFCAEAYRCVLEDIIRIYRDYCTNLNFTNDNSNDAADTPMNGTSSSPIDISGICKEFSEVVSAEHDTHLDFKTFPNTRLVITSSIFPFDDIDKEICPCEIDCLSASFLSTVIGNQPFDKIQFAALEDAIVSLHDGVNAKIVQERLRAVSAYYNDMLEDSIQALDAAYKLALDCSEIPEWIVMDLLIDLRNIKMKQSHRNNVGKIPDEQKLLSKFFRPTYYPVLNRFEYDAFKRVLDELVKESTKSPFTTYIGNDIIKAFESIADAFITALSYGSLTQMLMVRSHLVDALSALCTIYTDHSLYLELVKMLILTGDRKKYVSIERAYSPATNYISSADAMKFWSAACYIPLYDDRFRSQLMAWQTMRFQFDDNDFKFISEQLLSDIEAWFESSSSIVMQGYDIFDALKAVACRVDCHRVVSFVIKAIKRKMHRFVDQICQIIQNIDLQTLHEDTLNHLVETLLDYLVETKSSPPPYLLDALLDIRLEFGDSVKVIDSVLVSKCPTFYERTYSYTVFPEKKRARILESIKNINNQNITQGKNGSLFGYSVDDYQVIRIILAKEPSVADACLINEIFDAAKETLLSPCQLVGAKSSACQLILALLSNSLNTPKMISDLKKVLTSSDVFSASHMTFFETERDDTLRLNIYILQQIINDDAVQNILETLWYTDRADTSNIVSLLSSMRTLVDIVKIHLLPEQLIEGIIQFSAEMSTNKDREIRIGAVRILASSSQTCFAEGCLRRLSMLMDNETEIVKVRILQNITPFKEKYNSLYNHILRKGLLDNNHIVREIAQKIAKGKNT